MEECLSASKKGLKVCSGDPMGKDSLVMEGVTDQSFCERGQEFCPFGAANEGLGLHSGKHGNGKGKNKQYALGVEGNYCQL